MLCAGNDIVDSSSPAAQGKARNARFVQKVLTGDEQARLAAAQDPDRLLWAFWAAKEAAYKAASKMVPAISAAPRRYGVELDTNNPRRCCRGQVTTPETVVRVRIFFFRHYLHCIAAAGRGADPDALLSGQGALQAFAPDAPSATLHEHQSTAVREMAVRRIGSCLGLAPEDIRIIRSRIPRGHGPPFAYSKDRLLPVDLSLSHHGRFAGYAAFIKPPPVL
ncbi:MAG: 4'-phosphopantetheinyl transferase superfamily protein [Desulfosalsimonadaceae bacterium]